MFGRRIVPDGRPNLGWVLGFVLLGFVACAPQLELPDEASTESKARGDWPEAAEFPLEQDLAILLPRSTELRIGPQVLDASGLEVLPFDWVQLVGESFVETVVEDAFLTESRYGDWHVAAMRIVPCGPLGKVPSPINDSLCWPGVRIVWQPTIHNTLIRRRIREHYSDDRAMHVLYDYLPPSMASEVRPMLSAARAGQDFDGERFLALRDQAVETLLDASFLLRQNSQAPYEQLTYRWELAEGIGSGPAFMDALRGFIGAHLNRYDVHTVTAFSLPEGRLPGPIGLWTFVAFTAVDGRLTQQAIEIVDPDTGEVIGRLDKDETVGIAEGDARLVEQMGDSEEGRKLAEQVIVDRDDIERLRDKINDPSQTMVPNTSCATCHNFNRILFDFHNLSYFESLEITVAPRVERDVQWELDWTRRWLNE